MERSNHSSSDLQGKDLISLIAHISHTFLHPANYLLVLLFSGLEVDAQEIVQGPAPTSLVPPHYRFANLLQPGRLGRP
jgi:hypothetical protein